MNAEQKLRLRSQIKVLVQEGIAPLVNQVITQRLTQYAEYLHGELIPYPVTGQAAHHIETLTELRDERGEVFIAEIDIEAIDFAIEAINARERALAAAPAPAVERHEENILGLQYHVDTPPAEAREQGAQAVGDETLWCLHIEGPDDLYPAPSRELAQQAADMFNAAYPKSDDQNWPRAHAAVIEWPHGIASHALEASSFVRYWITPANLRGSESPAPARGVEDAS